MLFHSKQITVAANMFESQEAPENLSTQECQGIPEEALCILFDPYTSSCKWSGASCNSYVYIHAHFVHLFPHVHLVHFVHCVHFVHLVLRVLLVHLVPVVHLIHLVRLGHIVQLVHLVQLVLLTHQVHLFHLVQPVHLAVIGS